jgi:hypothetical protein
MDTSAHLQESDLLITQKIHKQSAEFQTPRTSIQCLTRKKGYHKYRPTFINKLRDHDMDVQQQQV